MTRPYFQRDGLACFAHRGGAKHWPENTLEAFRGGLEAGCGWIETDVHMTRDGHIVCFHDDDLERTTDGRGKIWELSLAELRRLDAGYRFSPDGRSFPFRGQGVRVPTLEETLALGARVNLEIKQADPPMVAALWQLIDAEQVHDRVLVASERDGLLREFRNLARGSVASSAGKAENFGFWAAVQLGVSDWLPLEFDALQVPVSFRGLQVISPRYVEAAHRRGLQVQVWTIDDLDEMRWLVEIGVDAIMTDEPARLVGLVEALGLRSEVERSTAAAPDQENRK